MGALEELDNEYSKIKNDSSFQLDFHNALKKFVGRPSPLYFAENLTTELGGAKIYLKREDLNHTGAHKINNAIGQVLLAKKMGKKRIIAETGAGQHGVATATAASLLGLDCIVYMGSKDVSRQELNVFRMELLGAQVESVTTGSQTLKDAVTAAIRDWVTNIDDSYYVIGSVVGPHPYPEMVRDFQRVIGDEAKTEFLQLENSLPDCIVACVGGGSNAMGIFYPFVEDQVDLYGVEAGGKGLSTSEHAAPLSQGSPGVLHGAKSYIMQDDSGQIAPVHSISAGLDYPGVGPEHAYLKEMDRANYVSITDNEALEALKLLSASEGIIPALESAHALAYAAKIAPDMDSNQTILVNLSGRGDKDVAEIRDSMTT